MLDPHSRTCDCGVSGLDMTLAKKAIPCPVHRGVVGNFLLVSMGEELIIRDLNRGELLRMSRESAIQLRSLIGAAISRAVPQ